MGSYGDDYVHITYAERIAAKEEELIDLEGRRRYMSSEISKLRKEIKFMKE